MLLILFHPPITINYRNVQQEHYYNSYIPNNKAKYTVFALVELLLFHILMEGISTKTVWIGLFVL